MTGNSRLVVAAAWPVHTRPDRLVESLVDRGATVTVAAEGSQARRYEASGAEVVVLPRASDVNIQALRQLARAVAGAATAPGRIAGVGRGLRGQKLSRRRLAEGWYRLLPLIGRHWDRVALPAEKSALAFLPLFGVVGDGEVVVERPPPRPSRPGGEPAAAAWRALLERAVEISCASTALAEAARSLGADRARIHVSPPTVDTTIFRPGPPPDGSCPVRLLCPAPFSWTAGQDYALVALRRLLDDGLDVHLDLVSEREDRHRVLYTVDDMGLASAVTVHEPGNRITRAARMAGADICVLSAVQDRPWPEVLEALSSGVLVVATDLDAVRAQVTPGVEGALVPGRDSDALAVAVARLVKDAATRGAMSAAARSRALLHVGAPGADPPAGGRP